MAFTLRKIRKADLFFISYDHANITSCSILSFLCPYSTYVFLGNIITVFFDLNLDLLDLVIFAQSYNCVTLVIWNTREFGWSPVINGLIFLKNEVVAD